MTHSTTLFAILEHKRSEVRAREALLPIAKMKALLRPSTRNYTGGFILECKKASPSEGLIRADFDVQQIARIYAPFAGAISILTDSQFFQGNLDFMVQASHWVPTPILCKDFIVSPYQVYEARLYQADMILLMLSVLDDETYEICAEAAKRFNLDVVTEVHDEAELERAIRLDARMIGVNNRDFKTLQVNLEVSRRLLPLIPKDKIKIVESGIETHGDILEFKNQTSNFLVGTSLMREKHLDMAVRELIFGRIKICGLTSVQTAQAAYDAGASFGGFNFASESPRCVSLEKALSISSQVPLRWVAVFVNASLEQVCEQARALKPFAVQLHGEESEAYVAQLREKLPIGIEIWKKTFPGSLESMDGNVTRFLFDTPDPKLHGGTGRRFEWSLIPKSIPKDRVILGGGLGPENIAEADQLGFWALDVNSRVEQAPGLKSAAKIQELFARLAQKRP